MRTTKHSFERLSRSICVVLALVAAPVATSPALAQSSASLSGVIRATSGTPVGSATVTLSGEGLDTPRTSTTGESGRYRFSELSPGAYALRVIRPGFREGDARVTLTGDQRLDIALVPVPLQEIVVTASRGEQEIARVPAAINVITRDEIQQGRAATHLEESLRRIPGVRVEDELGGTSRTRIIIRGTGTRANSPAGSGVRGVRVLVDGIPKNNGGGSAQDLINIDLESVERIEVLKGPSSALYGNQSGGVVNIITESGRPGGFFNVRETVGSYGLFREHAKFGGESGKLNYFASAVRTDQDGYRAQSRYNNTGFTAKTRYTINEKSNLTTLVGFDRQFSQSPGPLTEAQFGSNPRQADSTFLANNVRSTVEEFRLGVIYRRELLGQDALELTGYYIPRHLGPFQQIGVRIPQDFTNRGGGARYLYLGPLGRLANRLTIGAEFQNTPITTGTFNSVTGAALAELEENSTLFGAYVLDELSLRDNLQLSVGGRFDNIHFTSENLTRATPVASRLYQRFTPRVGATYQPAPPLSIYATYGKGFEAPVIGELRTLPGGTFGFNATLEPQISDNYEIGARGEPLRQVAFQVSVFHQKITNFISPFGEFPNNSFQNVGKVGQFGIETGVDVELFSGISAGLAYTFSDFNFDEFNNGVNDFTNNRLPGVPKHIFYGELRYRSPAGIYGAVELQSVSRIQVNDANTATTPPYTVANARIGYELDAGRVHLSPFLGVNNLGDKQYSAFALINDARSRFFNPLPELSAYGGLGLTF